MALGRSAALVTLLMVAGPTSAQSIEGYALGGVGRWLHDTGSGGTLMAGAGGVQWLPVPHVGIGGEGGLLTSVSGDLAAYVGVDARWHLRATPTRGWAPYVFVGYSPLRFVELADQGMQYGAGADYRLSAHRALRIELRDILRRSGSVRTHYWTARVGVAFR